MSFSETPEADALPNPSRLSGVRTSAEIDAEARRARAIADELAQQALAARQAEEAARRPQEPAVEAGLPEFVMFSRYESGRVYTYAAIGWQEGRGRTRVTRWAVTGQETRRFNWPGLLNFIGEANWHTLYQFTDSRSLMPAGAEPPVAEEMARYGRVRRTVPVYDAQDRP
ncbi:hypothetical protein I5G63_gp092 [Mycobacterium phage Imvubu]|uniref:Uncharacterized protein n=1 Tax=Mycobacterium phage Imvubu TaxID=2686233 RepID=A0A6B9L7P8_9CAUD|nr:hypothetical protein I5G63_gp092 [Mycobacterium phage Imvubu]QHB37832.1 hypothetical protein PBI_IMVUBU_92 [Mycobacterium phage Imvubu]